MFFQDIYDVTYCLWSHMSCGQLINVTGNRWLISLNLVTCHRETVLTENLYIFISFHFYSYLFCKGYIFKFLLCVKWHSLVYLGSSAILNIYM